MSKKQNILFIVLFGILLLAPCSLLLFRVQFGTNCDNNFGEKVKSKLKQPFFNSFEKKFNSTFAFDYVLTQYNALFKIKLFNASSHPEQALIGKDGFYFYTSQNDKILNNYSKNDLLSKNGLDSLSLNWANNFQELEQMQIELIHAVWPNKSTTYRELTPWNLRLQKKEGNSKTDQIINAVLAKQPNYPFVDTRELLIKNKEKKIYHKYDSHWKTDGAFLAFQKLLPNSFVAKQAYRKVKIKAWKYDLINLMGMCDSRFFPESEFDYQPINFEAKISDDKQSEFDDAFEAYNPKAIEKKHLMYFGDSYSLDTQFRTFLSWQYEHVTFFRSRINMEAIRKQKPDIVIIGNVERYF